MEKNVKESKLFGIKEDKDASWGGVEMDDKNKKANDDKVKRFDRFLIEILSSIFFSMATAILVHIWLMH